MARFERLFEPRPATMTAQEIAEQVDGLLHCIETSGPAEASAGIAQMLRRSAVYSTCLRTALLDGAAPSVLRRHALPLLRNYMAFLDSSRHISSTVTTEWDNLLLPLLIESRNATTSGSGGKLVTPAMLSVCIAEQASSTAVSTFVVDEGDHRFAAQLSTDAQRPPRLAILDSWRDQRRVAGGVLFRAKVPGAVAAPVLLGTQRAFGCTVFALDAIDRIAAHPQAIEDLYDGIGHDASAQPHALPLTMGESLPLDFFLHAQSTTPYRRLEKGRPDIRGFVVDYDGDKPLDLFQRWGRHRAIDSEGKPYSASIDVERRQRVAKAITYYEDEPARLDTLAAGPSSAIP